MSFGCDLKKKCCFFHLNLKMKINTCRVFKHTQIQVRCLLCSQWIVYYFIHFFGRTTFFTLATPLHHRIVCFHEGTWNGRFICRSYVTINQSNDQEICINYIMIEYEPDIIIQFCNAVILARRVHTISFWDTRYKTIC